MKDKKEYFFDINEETIKNMDKFLLICKKINSTVSDIEKEKNKWKNYKYESYFIKQYCNEEELKIFQEAINIAYISPRASFMMLRFFLETVFKRKIPVSKFHSKKKLIKSLEKYKSEYLELSPDSAEGKKIVFDNADKMINLLKSPNNVNLSNEFDDFILKEIYTLIDYRSLGNFTDISDEIVKTNKTFKVAMKQTFGFLNYQVHKNIKMNLSIPKMLMTIDIILLLLEEFIQNPENLDNYLKKWN